MSGEELTRVELGDLAAAYGWWKAHGDPEAFYDVLDDAMLARHAALLDERDALRTIVVGRVQHRYMGQCPDALDGFELRDDECPACAALDPQ